MPLGRPGPLARPTWLCRIERKGTRDRIHFRQRDTHLGLDHNIDSRCATAFDFERLLEVFLQQNYTLAQRPNKTMFFTEEHAGHFNLPRTSCNSLLSFHGARRPSHVGVGVRTLFAGCAGPYGSHCMGLPGLRQQVAL
jgi:hypothetical protein